MILLYFIKAERLTHSLKNLAVLSAVYFPLYPDEEESRDRLVKRVIATPGDEMIWDGKVYVNGEQLNEPM